MEKKMNKLTDKSILVLNAFSRVVKTGSNNS